MIEGYFNAVTANLILNIGSEPVNLQNWIHRRTALIQTTLDGAVDKWFSVLLNQIGSDSHKNFQKNSTPKETNNTREFYIMKCVESQTKQLKNL